MLNDTQRQDRAFNQDFKYTHNNPYHHRLQAFDGLVLRDTEAEDFKGQWSKKLFLNDSPIHLEIGTGYGHFMMDYTQKNPQANFVGLDHRFKRSFHLAKKLEKLTHKNFRYLRAKGERIGHLFEESEVSRIFYFFPDPWPKTRHHKKRLFQTHFLDLCQRVLTSSGELLIKTDHLDYFKWMVQFAKTHSGFSCEFLSYDLYQDEPTHELAQFQTKFERIFLEKNIPIKAMVLKVIK